MRALVNAALNLKQHRTASDCFDPVHDVIGLFSPTAISGWA
jgi:hypothetical protein